MCHTVLNSLPLTFMPLSRSTLLITSVCAAVQDAAAALQGSQVEVLACQARLGRHSRALCTAGAPRSGHADHSAHVITPLALQALAQNCQASDPECPALRGSKCEAAATCYTKYLVGVRLCLLCVRLGLNL